MTKEKKHELLLLVQQLHQEALLEEQEEQQTLQASVKAKPITTTKPASIETRMAIKDLIKQAKRSI